MKTACDKLNSKSEVGARRILIVDDEPEVLVSMRDLLEDMFIVHTASTGEEALALLKEHSITVLVTDQRMPGMAGDELLAQAALSSEATRVLLTGYSEFEAVVRAVNRGHIYAYVAKPYEPMEMRLTLARAAEHHDLVRSLNYERMLLEQLMKNVPDAIFFKDQSRRFTRVNLAKAKLVGSDDPVELIGQGDWDYFPEQEAARIEYEDCAVIYEGRPLLDKVESFTHPDGRTRWFSTSKVPLDGKGLVGISRDITLRKLAEQKLETVTLQLVEAQLEKQAFGRQVVLAVTGGKFHLVDAEEVPAHSRTRFAFKLEEPESHRELRRRIRELGGEVGLTDEAIEDVVLAAGEAAANTTKHARQASCKVGLDERGLVVTISDRGSGIQADDLANSLFRAGFSTKVSMGLGYTIILQVMDEIWLATGPQGTTIQMVKRPKTEASEEAEIDAFLESFS